MTVTPITTHVDDALGRMLEQYRDAAKLRSIVSAVGGEVQALEDAMQDMLVSRALPTAVGVQLDKIGTAVGFARPPNLSDEMYRVLLIAKVGLNSSQGETERVISIYRLITNATSVRLYEYFPAAVGLFSDGSVPAGLEPTILEFMEQVVAAGVSVNSLSIGTYAADTAFTIGTAEGETGYGFGDLNDTTLGGGLGSLVVA